MAQPAWQAYGQQTASTRSVYSVDGATRVLPATVDACGCEIFGHKQVHLTIILLSLFIYFLITIFLRKKLIRNSKIQLHESKKLTKTIQEGLGFIIDLIIGNNQEKLIKTQKYTVT